MKIFHRPTPGKVFAACGAVLFVHSLSIIMFNYPLPVEVALGLVVGLIIGIPDGWGDD